DQLLLVAVLHREGSPLTHDHVLTVRLVVYGDYNGPPPQTHESYCQHVIMSEGRPFAVEDGDQEQLVCNLKIVTEDQLLGYLGVPLIDPDGYVIGSLCVTSSKVTAWRPNDAFMLTSLAATAMSIAYPAGKSAAV
ncbi:MAG: GAF domain-containing protein, partial [Myxococcaceae bacterium]